jgi:magnesium-transporting ATPase (P-type)
MVTGTFSLFLWSLEQGASIETARSVAVNTLVAFEIFYLFNSRYILEPVLNREGLFGNRYVLLAVGLLVLFQLAFTYFPPMQSLFGIAAMSLSDWLYSALVASSVLWLVELEKCWLRRGRRAAAR